MHSERMQEAAPVSSRITKAGRLLHAIARKIVGDSCRDFLCRRDVGIGAVRIPLLELGKSASIERACELRIEPQRRGVVLNGGVPLLLLQIGEPTRVEGGGVLRLQP